MSHSKKGKKKSPGTAQNQSLPRLPQHPPAAPVACYAGLLNRFYLPLVLLRMLGQARGERTPAEQCSGSDRCIRRRFLRNLCYVCDYKKGGDTTTAMAMAERPDGYTFWIAANVDASSKIVPFARDILEELRSVLDPVDFEGRCLEFAQSRIRGEVQLLRLATRKCLAVLDIGPENDKELARWLQELSASEDTAAICRRTYEIRKSDQMRALKIQSGEPYQRYPGSAKCLFAEVRHCIGRLAYHIRAARQLIEDSRRLQRIFDSFEIEAVPLVTSVNRPTAKLSLDSKSILGRMLREGEGDEKFGFYQQALDSLDAKFLIFKQIQRQYQDGNFRPRVHAEIQVLEHFHEYGLQFTDNDRYIACSKPACYCCHLYFQHHPEGPVIPGTHRKIWLNWGPPRSAYDSDTQAGKRQRVIMDKMLLVIRADALRDIGDQERNMRWHADSHTGITESVQDGIDQTDDDIPSDGFISPDEETLSDDEVLANEWEFSSPWRAPVNGQVEIEGRDDSDFESDGGVSLGEHLSALSFRG